MSRLDDLPADQRAVLQLVLAKGRSYAEIARALRLGEDAVRRRAHVALDALGPATPASREDRARAADWLLGQQDEAGEQATARLLAEDEDARSWVAAVRAELAALAAHDLPDLPAPSVDFVGSRPTNPTLDGEHAPALPAIGTAPGARRVSRRGGAILLGAIALAAVVALALVLRGGGDDNDSPKTSSQGATTTGAQQQAANRVLAQVNLEPANGSPASKALGIVALVLVNGNQSLTAEVQGLKVTKDSSWGIWAEGGPDGRRWLGPFSQGDQQGHIYAAGRLEPDMDILKYRRIVVSRDTAKTPPKQQGRVYLAGAITAPQQGG